MDSSNEKIFGLSSQDKQKIIDRIRRKAVKHERKGPSQLEKRNADIYEIPEEYYRVDTLPGIKQIQIQKTAGEKFKIANPFFRMHEAVAGNTTTINGKQYVNFSSYNYLGLCGHPSVSNAAKKAIDIYGTSSSASRPVSGERPIHKDLEMRIAEIHGTEDAIAMVSGHATNVTTIGCLFGKNDLILHDSLSHNSIIQGALLSGAKRLSFPHNDCVALEKILEQNRLNYQRVLIVIEGMYSMDGDIPDLPRFIEIKKKYKCFLMVDEAHSLGVLGENGHGIKEYFDVPSNEIDLLMGTLSKTLSACGGYIAGKKILIENLKFNAPGFVYSVGISPPVAAAALAALKILDDEPQRTHRLKKLGRLFLEHAKKAGLDTGLSEGYAIIPIIVGNSILSVKLSNKLFELGVNVQPIIYPAVEEKSARLRFFLNSTHTEDQIEGTISLVKRELRNLKRNPVYKFT